MAEGSGKQSFKGLRSKAIRESAGRALVYRLPEKPQHRIGLSRGEHQNSSSKINELGATAETPQVKVYHLRQRDRYARRSEKYSYCPTGRGGESRESYQQ